MGIRIGICCSQPAVLEKWLRHHANCVKTLSRKESFEKLFSSSNCSLQEVSPKMTFEKINLSKNLFSFLAALFLYNGPFNNLSCI